MSESATARPEIDPAMKALVDVFPMTFTKEDGVENARTQLRALAPPPESLPPMRIEERTIGVGDLVDVPARIYWPTVDTDGDLPVVVFYHGGGWAIGDLDTHEGVARMHAIAADAIVVSVDYRLAPEHPFPAGIEDAWSALQWVGEHAAELGGDPSRIAVAGDSAGGNISAVMTQLARDHGGPVLVFQLLWYPSVSGDMTLPSMIENADAPVLDRDVIAAFLDWYLPADLDIDHPETFPPTLAPANTADLSGLPPAYIGTAGHDPIRDDGARYADSLRAAGVPVELNEAATLVHGFVNFAPVIPAAGEATQRGLSALAAALR